VLGVPHYCHYGKYTEKQLGSNDRGLILFLPATSFSDGSIDFEAECSETALSFVCYFLS
jgi:hypothetical protein